MRVLVLLLSSLLLGACTNMVRSQTPWFGPAAAGGAPPLRDGVWAAVDPDCRFDANGPLERWPACAEGRVIRGGQALTLNSSSHGQGRSKRVDYDWSSEAFVLAAGVPRIHQSDCGPPRSAPVATSADEAVNHLIYCYAGLRPDAFDPEGRIVAFTTWPIWCGPFPQRAEGESGPNVTDAPFAGITVVGEHCVAADIPALRAAATASEIFTEGGETSGPPRSARFRWVRDGWR